MRDIRWLEPAKEAYLGMIEKLVQTDTAQADELTEKTAQSLSELTEHATAYPHIDSNATLREIAITPYCHLVYNVTDMMIIIVAAVPSREWWETGDFLH